MGGTQRGEPVSLAPPAVAGRSGGAAWGPDGCREASIFTPRKSPGRGPRGLSPWGRQSLSIGQEGKCPQGRGGLQPLRRPAPYLQPLPAGKEGPARNPRIPRRAVTSLATLCPVPARIRACAGEDPDGALAVVSLSPQPKGKSQEHPYPSMNHTPETWGATSQTPAPAEGEAQTAWGGQSASIHPYQVLPSS